MTPEMRLFSAGVSFAVAIFVGGWRNYGMQSEREASAFCPLAWGRAGVPFFSFLLVAVTALGASFVCATWLGGGFCGASLALRWVLSSVIGIHKAKQEAARGRAHCAHRLREIERL